MKALLIILALSLQAVLAGDIVVLTSLHVKDKKLNKIIRYVQKSYPDRLNDIKYIKAATAKDLASAIQSENTEMLFYVSHAAKSQSLGVGINAKATVLDYHGNNIKNLFSTVHPNVKFLALVGCQAKGMIDGFIANNNYQMNTGMNIFSFYKKVNLFRGVKMALQASHNPSINLLVSKIENQTIDPERVSIEVTRDSFGHDSLIEIGDKSFIFPEGDVELNVEIPENVWVNFKSKNIKNYILQKESEDEADYTLAKLNITSEALQKSWKPFAKPNGEMLGTFKHLYIMKK